MSLHKRSFEERRPWSIDRYGRLLAGISIAACSGLAVLHDPLWLYATLAIAGNLVVTSLTDRCVLHDALIKLGAREREDLFYPGGAVRAKAGAGLPRYGRSAGVPPACPAGTGAGKSALSRFELTK